MRLSFLPAERLHEAHTHISINIFLKKKKTLTFAFVWKIKCIIITCLKWQITKTTTIFFSTKSKVYSRISKRLSRSVFILSVTSKW